MERRTLRNPRYSLRAYARDLGVSPSTISEVLNGHHSLSMDRANELSTRLGWEEKEKRIFLAAVSDMHKSRYAPSLKREFQRSEPELSIGIAPSALPVFLDVVKDFEKKHPPRTEATTTVDLYVTEQ